MSLKANLTETIGRSVRVEFNPICLPDETIQVLSEKESTPCHSLLVRGR
ncbi:MAG: hypothetical protein KJ077_47895 [Anaerolineae bacterium]|nr:hypothetical protein [Anaerolineae bacterium]